VLIRRDRRRDSRAAGAIELLALAWIRRWFFGAGFLRSFIPITLGGPVIATIGAALGAVN
jgi:hypothetical protein